MAKRKSVKAKRALVLGATAIDVLPPEISGAAIPVARGFALTVNGLAISGRPGFDATTATARLLCVAEKASPFAIGDAQIYAAERFGERASQIFDADLGLSLKTLAVYEWVAKRIHPSRRRMDRLGIRHHLLVAPLGAAKQKEWLTRAAADDETDPWTVRRLADALNAGEDVAPTAYWLMIACADETEQAQLQAQFEAQGKSVKALVRRRRASEPAAVAET